MEAVETTSSQSSQSTTEQEVSIWVDEIEGQHRKRQKLNETVDSITTRRYSLLRSTLNTSWDDISQTQQRYYLRKATETITAALSVICPGQEQEVWKSLRLQSSLSDNAEPKNFQGANTSTKTLNSLTF